jgi:cytochrome c-type biogenesis protein CcmF
LRWPLILGGGALILATLVVGVDQVLAAGGLALGVILIAGALAILAQRWRIGQARRTSLSRLVLATPLPVWGLVLAHLGLGVTTIGITGVSAFQDSKILAMTPGQSVTLANYRVTLDAIAPVIGPNYQADRASFRIDSAFGRRELVSERRFFPGSQTTTTKAGIGVGLFGNTYISVGDRTNNRAIVVRMWDHPFVDWIWVGALFMALGGGVALADRRVRVRFFRSAGSEALAAGPAE